MGKHAHFPQDYKYYMLTPCSQLDSKHVSIVVQNMTDSAIFLKKGVQCSACGISNVGASSRGAIRRTSQRHGNASRTNVCPGVTRKDDG